MVDSKSLWQAEHKIHVLHSLSRSTLDEVVRYREYHRRVAALRAVDRNAAEV